ncbi:MAG: Gfo/Idh/MocA family oxidoreductase, partial [bacterium]
MTSRDKPLRVALLGARGIGRAHARIFHALGAEICAVLGSSQESATDATRMLKDSLGIDAKPFNRIESLLDTARPDAMSICTPPQLHFAEIVAAFDHDIPVFCEKPIFWHEGIQRSVLEK